MDGLIAAGIWLFVCSLGLMTIAVALQMILWFACLLWPHTHDEMRDRAFVQWIVERDYCSDVKERNDKRLRAKALNRLIHEIEKNKHNIESPIK